MAVYRNCTGFDSIPQSMEYWSLCSIQHPAEPSCEIEQMIAAGFLTQAQFVGVDRNETIIAGNAEHYPEARWYSGEWTDAILENDGNPSLIHLDTLNEADNTTVGDLVSITLDTFPEAILAVNVITRSPYSHRAVDVGLLVKNISSLRACRVAAAFSYAHTTEMSTLILCKQ